MQGKIKEIEQPFLASLIAFPNELKRVAPRLKRSDFSSKDSQIAFQVIEEMASTEECINPNILIKKVTERGGNKSYLENCIRDSIPVTGQLNAHAKIIAEESYKRNLARIGSQLDQDIKNGKSIDELESILDECDELRTEYHIGTNKSLVAITIADFLTQEHPPRTNILSPWLPSQGLCMIFSWRGVGKTHVSLGLACALTAGDDFLNWSAPNPVGVVFIDGEMPAAVLQKRLQSIIAGMDKQSTAPFKIITPDNQSDGMPDLATVKGQQLVEEHITDDIQVIIIDNLSTLVRTGRENDAESWAPVQSWFLKLRAAGKSVVAIHHSNKSGQSRGTSKREDVLDTVIRLERPNDYTPDQGACFEVHFEKSRGIYGDDTRPFEAQLTTGKHGEALWTTRSIEDSNYLKIIKLHKEGLANNEIAEEIGIHKSNVSRNLKKAVKNGDING